MSKRYFHFVSNEMFNLYINGEYVTKCNVGESVDLVVNSPVFNYMLCPISDKVLVVDNGIVVNKSSVDVSSPCLKLVPFINNHYNLYYKPAKIYNLSKSEMVLEKTCGSVKFCIYNNPIGVIEVLGKDNKSFKKQLDYSIEVGNIETKGKYVIISSALENNKRHIIVLSSEFDKVYFDEVCDDVEISENEIKALIDFKNITCTAQVVSFNLLTEEKSQYLICLEKKQVKYTDEVLVYAFLQSLKFKDFKTAKTFLSDAFGEIGDIQLQNYFGEIKDIYYNNYMLTNIINFTIERNNDFKSFNFDIINGKIEDIKEVQF